MCSLTDILKTAKVEERPKRNIGGYCAMNDVILKNIMDNVIKFLQSPTGRIIITQAVTVLPHYLYNLKANFQQTYTKIEEVNSEGKVVIKKIQETKFAVNEPDNSIITQADNITINNYNVTFKDCIYTISPDSFKDYKETIYSSDVLLKRMNKVDIENIKNKDVQIEVNNCMDTSDELLKKIQSLIEKRSIN